jgi:hypothetical protein
MNYCPICDAEYTAAHKQCTVCGVDLVPEEHRGKPLDEQQRNEPIVVAWRGGDPLAVSEVVSTLREAGILHHVQPTNDHMVFELGMPRPKYAVRVFSSDAANAKALLGDIRETAPFDLGESPDTADLAPSEPERAKHEYTAKGAIVEIWKGEDGALAELLEACLHENSIGVNRVGAEPGPLQLLVMPEDESSAREIIREVRDGTPPA